MQTIGCFGQGLRRAAARRNLERLYRLAMGAELEARLAALEQREQEEGADDARPA